MLPVLLFYCVYGHKCYAACLGPYGNACTSAGVWLYVVLCFVAVPGWWIVMSNGIFFSQLVGCLCICTYGLMLVLLQLCLPTACGCTRWSGRARLCCHVCLFVSAGACNLTNYSMSNHGEWWWKTTWDVDDGFSVLEIKCDSGLMRKRWIPS